MREDDDYPGHEDELRERMERDRDILRGLGQMPTLGDMRSYYEDLQWARLADMERRARRREDSDGH